MHWVGVFCTFSFYVSYSPSNTCILGSKIGRDCTPTCVCLAVFWVLDRWLGGWIMRQGRVVGGWVFAVTGLFLWAFLAWLLVFWCITGWVWKMFGCLVVFFFLFRFLRYSRARLCPRLVLGLKFDFGCWLRGTFVCNMHSHDMFDRCLGSVRVTGYFFWVLQFRPRVCFCEFVFCRDVSPGL